MIASDFFALSKQYPIPQYPNTPIPNIQSLKKDQILLNPIRILQFQKIKYSTLTMTSKPTILLRNEYKLNEHRTALTPSDMKSLNALYDFQVESSQSRIFSNEEYENIGAKIVPEGSWTTFNVDNGYVLGLKELPDPGAIMTHNFGTDPEEKVETPFELKQRHIMFAHCYKYQNDWRTTLKRFNDGNGELLDLEFLQWDNGRRVAAFGRAAGFAGMAVGLLGYVAQKLQSQGNLIDIKLSWYRQNDELVNYVKDQLSLLDELPTILVLGALGRCGNGAIELAVKAGIPDEKIIKWDLAETKVGGPFPQLLELPNILVNCIYVNGKMEPFIDFKLIENIDSKKSRKLSMFVDVSCEMSENNPFPINSRVTTFPAPFRRIIQRNGETLPLDCCAIDHLPAMIPRQSSEDFSRDMLDVLKALATVSSTKDLSTIEKLSQSSDDEKQRVWYRAKALFQKKLVENLK